MLETSSETLLDDRLHSRFLLNIFVLLGQFLILLMISLPRGLNTFIQFCPNNDHVINLSVLSSSTEIIKTLGIYDSASYLIGAQKFLSGWISDSDSWFLACWPPGFFLIESFFLKILGPDCPIILCLLLMTVSLWTLALWNIYLSLKQWQSGPVAAILSLSLCFTILFDRFFLQTGVILSESTSTALLILCFALTVRLKANSKWFSYLLAGICLSGAAYIRGQIELFTLCLLSLLIINAFVYFISSPDYRHLFSEHFFKQLLAVPLHRLLLVVIIAQLIMLPYRINNYVKFGSPAWLRVDHYWKLMWKSDSTLLKNDGEFAVKGGMSIATKLNPKLAQEIENNLTKFGDNYYSSDFYKDAVIKTFIKNPMQWLSLKSTYIPYSWFDSFYNARARVNQIENWLYLLLLLPLLGVSIMRTFRSYKNVYFDNTIALFFFAVLLTLLMCSILVHFEARYFYILKITSIVTTSFYIAIYSLLTKKHSTSKSKIIPHLNNKLSAIRL